MGSWQKDDIIKILKNLKRLFNEHKDYLVELDGRMGDGDLGLTMAKGFAAVYDELKDTEEIDIGRIFMKSSSISCKAFSAVSITPLLLMNLFPFSTSWLREIFSATDRFGKRDRS